MQYISDKVFIAQIEESVYTKNSKTLVAQFPYISFPESGGKYNMRDYEQVQGYLHSEKLHWSFGSVRGREADAWWKDLIQKPIQAQVQTLQEAGFSGVMINRNGYKDNGALIEEKLSRFLQIDPMISDNKKLSFFKFDPTGDKIALPPTFNGFHSWEGGEGNFRWSGSKKPKLSLYNASSHIKEHQISFVLGTLKDRNLSILLNGEELDHFKIKKGEKIKRSYSLQLEPGRNILRFITDVKPERPGGADSRKLSFSLESFVYD